MKKFILITICLLMYVCCGCSAQAKNEDEILSDIISNSEVFQTHEDLNVTEFRIDNRKTDSEGKTDNVYFTLKAENDSFTYDLVGGISYYLYDQGWQVEGVTENNSKIVPIKCDVTQETVDGVVKGILFEKDSWSAYPEVSDTSLEDGEAYFFYTVKDNSSTYWVEEYGLVVTYQFDDENGWIYKDYELSELGGYWNEETLCGTWRREDNTIDGYFEITIYDIEDTDGIVYAYLKCDFDDNLNLLNPLQITTYGGFDFKDDYREEYSYQISTRGIHHRYVVELDRRIGVEFDGYRCEKVKSIIPLREPEMLAPKNELEKVELREYEELLSDVAGTNVDADLCTKVLDVGFNEMCEVLKETIKNDCIVYENENEFIALLYMDVKEGEMKPYYDYMFFHYNSETEKGRLFGKVIEVINGEDKTAFYCASGLWSEQVLLAEGNKGIISGYCPVKNASVLQYIKQDGNNGYTFVTDGVVEDGLWTNIVSVDYYMENRNEHVYSYVYSFSRGFFVDAMDDGIGMKGEIIDIITGEKTETQGANLFWEWEQDEAYGIMGFGDIFY